MRPLDRLILFFDRTMVLFIGIAVGAIVGISFLPIGTQSMDAKASPVLPPPARQANLPAIDAPMPRLSSAIAAHRRIEVGVFGDSFGDGVWAGLYHNLPTNDGSFAVHQLSERSTGFTRYRSLNLLDDIRAKLDAQPLDIAILSFGANDTQGIYLDGHGHAFMSDGWQQIVTARVTAIVTLLRQRGIAVYWVGLPKMREPGFDADIGQMNAFYAGRMRMLGVPYYETVSRTVDENGRYAPYLMDPSRHARVNARANDGIHMTIPGYVIIMRGLSERIQRSVAEARGETGRTASAR